MALRGPRAHAVTSREWLPQKTPSALLTFSHKIVPFRSAVFPSAANQRGAPASCILPGQSAARSPRQRKCRFTKPARSVVSSDPAF